VADQKKKKGSRFERTKKTGAFKPSSLSAVKKTKKRGRTGGGRGEKTGER